MRKVRESFARFESALRVETETEPLELGVTKMVLSLTKPLYL